MKTKATFRFALLNKRRGRPDLMGGNRGFTLVEMLVVIVIIAVLVGVSLAGFSAAMSHARKIRCMANLHSIGVGMLQFAGDNNQCLPESGGTIAHGMTDTPSPPGSGLPSWTEQLEPYLGPSTDTLANKVYQCPDYPKKGVAGDAQYSYFNGGHAAYSAAGGNFAAVSLAKVRNLSSFIISGDCAFPSFYLPNDADKDDYGQDPAFNGSSPSSPVTIPIHGGVSNILFADGHVESLKYFDPTLETTVYSGKNTSYLVP